MRTRRRVIITATSALISLWLVASARADQQELDDNESPAHAHCGELDTPEHGIQGDKAPPEGVNCGLSLLSELPAGNAVQGADHCVYVRTDGGVLVFDISDPTAPEQIGEPLPVRLYGDLDDRNPLANTSETMRALVTTERAVLVSGYDVWDISDCERPDHKGQLEWTFPFGHDIRISHDGNRVFASPGVNWWDISDWDDPSQWTWHQHTCDVAAQYHPVFALTESAETRPLTTLCRPEVYELEKPVYFPQLSHGDDDNQSGTRLFVGSQVPTHNANPLEESALRMIDTEPALSGEGPPVLLDTLQPLGPGHSIDWFRTADGREFLLHANESTSVPGGTCLPHPRPLSGFLTTDAFITEIVGDRLVKRGVVELAITRPENCLAMIQSGAETAIAYHSINDPLDPRFAMLSFGAAGMRMVDIRTPANGVEEVAYFNRGALVHAGVSHYDAERGIIVIPRAGRVMVLEIQPQVFDALGMPHPDDPAYPRFPEGRPATP